jgi:hypothetical protein
VALERSGAALPEQPDEFDGLLQHRLPLPHRGPAIAEDVLVEPLTRADAEEEAALEHVGCGGGRLRDQRRVDADQWARDAGADRQPARLAGDAAEHRPDERLCPCASIQGWKWSETMP